MKRRHSGFTLIELMIVVAIVGILSSVAIPMYMEFLGKSKWKSAYFELSQTRISIDVFRNQGETPTLAQINVPVASVHCKNALQFNADGVGTYECTINGGPNAVNDRLITLTRDVDGVWSCATTVKQNMVGETAQCTGT